MGEAVVRGYRGGRTASWWAGGDRCRGTPVASRRCGNRRRGHRSGARGDRHRRGHLAVHPAEAGRPALERPVPVPRGEVAELLGQLRGGLLPLLRLQGVGRRHHLPAGEGAARLRRRRRGAGQPRRHHPALHRARRGRGTQAPGPPVRHHRVGGRLVPRPAAHVARRRRRPQVPARTGFRRRRGGPVPHRLGARRLGPDGEVAAHLADRPGGDRTGHEEQGRSSPGLLPGPDPVPDHRRARACRRLRRPQDARRRRTEVPELP